MGRWQFPQFSSPKSWNWSWEGLKIASAEGDLKTFLGILSRGGRPIFLYQKITHLNLLFWGSKWHTKFAVKIGQKDSFCYRCPKLEEISNFGKMSQKQFLGLPWRQIKEPRQRERAPLIMALFRPVLRSCQCGDLSRELPSPPNSLPSPSLLAVDDII